MDCWSVLVWEFCRVKAGRCNGLDEGWLCRYMHNAARSATLKWVCVRDKMKMEMKMKNDDS